MRRRVFIAINLPEKIKKELINYQSKWKELPCRWIKKENLHLTLVFLNYLRDEELLKVLKTLREISQRHKSFSINLNKICYGPLKKMPPRMVWIVGKKNQELTNLQKDLENSLFFTSIKNLSKSETRIYFPHITLGRIRQWEFRRIDPEEKPEEKIKEEISLSFEVNSIEIMESQLKRGGAEYTILESYEFSR